ncbi:hypothetical protein FHY55_06515 [Oceanicola sp. D3]|uniref:hypothetical protein n=1 Tax=Oceanicola sp. D3 TaxID=2587163 RepID=UPI00111E092A|nr:hypothetical protein [Oceanicola sp. D3]QDC08916.1 hypothetical protein FHY55_06515 [Oceanicola sp. D3]
MRNLIATFAREDDGAVTVDWVVLTGAMAVLGVTVALILKDGAINHSTSLGNKVGAISVLRD